MNIKTVIALPVAFMLGMLAALILLAYSPAPASAQEGEENQGSEEKQEATDESSYQYVAQSGDSYTEIARKAVQTYGINHDVDLSQNRIIYAETNLTRDAGSPLLNIGEKVSISEDKVKTWVEKAEALSKKQASLWDVYVSGVDFNTDSIGESR